MIMNKNKAMIGRRWHRLEEGKWKRCSEKESKEDLKNTGCIDNEEHKHRHKTHKNREHNKQ